MKVRRVRLQGKDGYSVAVWDEERWVPLVPALTRYSAQKGSDPRAGCSGMETGQWLAPGDEIELTIEGIGSLRNIVGTPV